jgi:hypothetical protein
MHGMVEAPHRKDELVFVIQRGVPATAEVRLHECPLDRSYELTRESTGSLAEHPYVAEAFEQGAEQVIVHG